MVALLFALKEWNKGDDEDESAAVFEARARENSGREVTSKT